MNTIDLQPDDIVVEIGPGQGALTAYLLESGAEIHAIEYDKDLIPLLEDKFSEFSNFISIMLMRWNLIIHQLQAG